MSFVTRCPACGTAFRVVPDQLKISDGWVRCGRCQDVFDATLSLQPWWPGAIRPLEPEVPAELPPEAEYEAVPEPEPGDVPAVLREPSASVPVSAQTAEPLEPESEPQPQAQTVPEPEPPVWPPASADELPVAEVVSMLPVPEAVSDSSPMVDDLAFVQQARRKAVWRRGPVRGMLLTLALVLSLGLAGQWLWLGRDWVVATWPAAKPWMERVCGVVRYQLSPWRRIEVLVLDDVSLRRQVSGGHVFEAQIRNPSAQELAVPALELSLTDDNGAVSARRVFLPSDWPEAPLTLAPRSDWPLRLELELLEGSPGGVAGYRALIFYP